MTDELAHKAKELTDVLKEHFTTLGTHDRFTLWGVSYFWNGSGFDDAPKSSTFVNDLFEHIKRSGREIEKPKTNVRRSKYPALHQMIRCLVNRDHIEFALKDLLGEHYLDAEPLLTDSRLVTQALDAYVRAHKVGVVEETIDLFTFMVGYDVAASQMRGQDEGTYVPLARRLIFRYGEEEVARQIFLLGDTVVSAEAKQRHREAVYGKDPSKDDDLRELYEGLFGVQYPVVSKLKPRLKRKLAGKILVKKQDGGAALDWGDFFNRLDRHHADCRTYDSEAIYCAKMRNELVTRHLKLYEGDPTQAMESLEYAWMHAKGKAKQVYLEVKDIFSAIHGFDTSPDIGHTLHLFTRGDREE